MDYNYIHQSFIIFHPGLYTTFIFKKPDPEMAPPITTPVLPDGPHIYDEASVIQFYITPSVKDSLEASRCVISPAQKESLDVIWWINGCSFSCMCFRLSFKSTSKARLDARRVEAQAKMPLASHAKHLLLEHPYP